MAVIIGVVVEAVVELAAKVVDDPACPSRSMLPMLPLEARLWVDLLKESPRFTMPLEVVLKERTLHNPPSLGAAGIQSGLGRDRKSWSVGRELVRGRWAAAMSSDSLGRGRFLKEEEREWGAEAESRSGDTRRNRSSSDEILSPSTRMSIITVAMVTLGEKPRFETRHRNVPANAQPPQVRITLV